MSPGWALRSLLTQTIPGFCDSASSADPRATRAQAQGEGRCWGRQRSAAEAGMEPPILPSRPFPGFWGAPRGWSSPKLPSRAARCPRGSCWELDPLPAPSLGLSRARHQARQRRHRAGLPGPFSLPEAGISRGRGRAPGGSPGGAGAAAAAPSGPGSARSSAAKNTPSCCGSGGARRGD